MPLIRLFLAIALLSHAGAASGADLVLEGCLVLIQDEAEIPAPEAGVLIHFPMTEGSRVTEGEVLATIDDREARARLNIAEYGLQAATARSKDMVEEKYARKAAAFAKVDLEIVLDARRRTKDSVSEIEVRQKQLAWERAKLQVEKAQKDRELAGLDKLTKEAERDAAKMQLEWRTISAPFGGEVVSVKKHQAEWVQPGEPILKLVRYDNLYVEGFVKTSEFDRGDLLGRKVTTNVVRTRGQSVEVVGKIVYTELAEDGAGNFLVRAEIPNLFENDTWLILPGMLVKMTIHLDETASKPAALPVGAQAPTDHRHN